MSNWEEKMDALNVIRQNHRKLKELLSEAEEAKEGNTCKQLFMQIEMQMGKSYLYRGNSFICGVERTGRAN
jgi:phage terminase large subunit